MAIDEETGDLFEDVIFYLSPSIPLQVLESLRAVLRQNGGVEIVKRDAMHKATHIISNSSTLEDNDGESINGSSRRRRADQVVVTVSVLLTLFWVAGLSSDT